MAFRTLQNILDNNEQDNLIVAGLVQKYLQTNEYLAWADAQVTTKPKIIVNSIADYGAVQKGMDCNTDYTSVPISGASDEFELVKYGRQFETCLDVVGLGSDYVDQLAEDTGGALKAIANEISVDAITGTGSGEIAGLNTLITDSVAASTVGGAGDVESLWYLFDQVKAKSDKMALVMNARTKRAVLSELLSVLQVGTQEIKGTSFVVPSFNGAAILVNDAMTNGDIALINGGFDEGIFPVIGAFPSNKLDIFNFYKVGMSQSKDTDLYRLNIHAAHVRKSRQAAAKITGWVA